MAVIGRPPWGIGGVTHVQSVQAASAFGVVCTSAKKKKMQNGCRLLFPIKYAVLLATRMFWGGLLHAALGGNLRGQRGLAEARNPGPFSLLLFLQEIMQKIILKKDSGINYAA